MNNAGWRVSTPHESGIGDATNHDRKPEPLTDDVDQDAQSTLQHVVISSDQANGQRRSSFR